MYNVPYKPFPRKMIPVQIGWRGSLIANTEDFLEIDQSLPAEHLDHYPTKMRIMTILHRFFKIMHASL
jgi:hypothetical protein